MGIRNVLVCILILTTVSAQSLPDPKLVRIRKLTRAINSFGFKLFVDLTLYERQFSVIICPYSLSSSFGMLHYESVGKTEKELADVLEYKAVNLTKDQVAHTFYLFATQLLQSSKPKFYIFNAASTIIVNGMNGPPPTVHREVEVLFQTPITVVHFKKLGDDLVLSVNDGIAARRKNKIRDIVYYADPSSDIIVFNTAYFKGVWRHKFPPAKSKLGIFYNQGSKSRATLVHMMSMTKVLHYNHDKDCTIIELPFKGRNVSMIIFLPRKLDGIRKLLNRFSPNFLEAKIRLMSRIMTHIALPKFTIDFDDDLTRYLRELGVQKLFQDSNKVYHKTLMSVTENGVETAATTVNMTLLPSTSMLENPHFLVDHPFLFVIYERRIKMVLFMGFVMEV